MERMGFEKERFRPHQSYGRSGSITIDGVTYKCASEAEARWLMEVCPGLRSGDVAALQWQPEGFPLDYKYQGNDGRYFYKPDAIITWPNGEEWVIEIKHGKIEQISCTKMIRFCNQYPDKKLVLVWCGRPKKKGPTFFRLQKLQPWLDHIWYLK